MDGGNGKSSVPCRFVPCILVGGDKVFPVKTRWGKVSDRYVGGKEQF